MPATLKGVIRTARSDDGPALFAIRRAAILAAARPDVAHAWANAHAPEWIADVLERRRVWVFECDAGIAGWASATGNRVDALYTSPDHFRQGVASALLTFAEHELRRIGFADVVLNASLNAERFYRARGYIESDQPRHALDSPHRGSLPMRKSLDAQ